MTTETAVTLEDVCDVVRMQLGLYEVAASDHLVEDLSAASVDIVNIVATLEEKYAIEISEQALANLATVQDLHTIAARLRRAAR